MGSIELAERRRLSVGTRGRMLFLIAVALLGMCLEARAARIADLAKTEIWDQAVRFFTLRDPAVRYSLLGSALLGICCGLLGSFIVVRKMALVGDALSHAVLPGVALGFLWNMSKDPLAIFAGATVAGLLGTAVVQGIIQTTRLKEDAALGLVLATFFAVGICLLTMIQQLPTGNKSGLDKFLFGQAAAIGRDDLILMSGVTVVVVILLVLFFKEFLLTSFDAAFARVVGFPTQLMHYLLMLMLAFAVVIALQAVGVVLVSAMLITPASAAFLLTDRMSRMLVLSAAFGMGAGALGSFLSFLSPALPTGPFMVLGATTVFLAAFLFAPQHGVLTRWSRQRSRSRRTRRENTLKSVYHVLEGRAFRSDGVALSELAGRRSESPEEALAQAEELRRHGLVTLADQDQTLLLTPEGWRTARSIVRNHRLWELYLTNAAQIAADHVHDDAEKIEHVLGEEVVRQLERRLDYATRDPHGKAIPSVEEVHREAASSPRRVEGTGYGGEG